MSLILTHTPGEWDGTFAFTVRELVKDLLLDGDTQVIINGDDDLRTLVGYSPGNDCLVFEGNEVVGITTEIDRIEVP